MAASLPQNDGGCYVVEVDSNSQEPCLKSVVREIEETEAQSKGLLKPKSEGESSDSDRTNIWDSSDEGPGLKILAIDETALVHTSEIVKDEEKMGKCGESKSLGADVKEKNVQVLQEKRQRKRYSRKELEGLRNVEGVEGQMKKWTEIYCGLGPLVQEKYDALVVRHQHRNQKTKKCIPMGEGSSVYTAGKENPKEVTFNPLPVKHENGCPIEQEYEEYDTDEEYSSILKPAFAVSGEPDFESGPPEDGFEYLRRVRWEAAQLPKVKIAKVDRSILSAEQTNYMPQIPNLAKCPEQLMPLKEWEDAFLTDFSDLRMALSCCEDSEEHLQSSAMCEEGSSKLLETILENFGSMPCEGDSSQSSSYSIPQTYDDPQCPVVAIDNNISKASKREASAEYPTLSMVMQMDSVARVSNLRKRISLVESASNISRNDCIWLFALSAAVDSPLDADTCASFRSLLRKCALLRAEKSVVDEEVAMLNILIIISGRYFGQLEH